MNTTLYIYTPGKRAWSIKHPSGVTYTRDTFAEAIETAHELSAGMRSKGIGHYTCRVFKTYGARA